MKMRKPVAVLLAVLMLCSIIPFSVAAESASATITFDDVSKRTEFDPDHQVWQENGITVINNKDDATNSVADYAKPARFYKGSTLIVEYPGMTKIAFTCNSASYATALQSAIEGATVDGQVVTVTLTGVDSFSCALTGGQVRVDSLTVYTGEGGETPVDPPVEPDVPDVPDVPVDPSVSATITFDDVSKRTEFEPDRQVWQENGITVINNKDDATNNVADYAKPARFYKGSTLIVEYPGMTKIAFTCNTTSYATALQSAIEGATVDGQVVTVTLTGVDSFSCALTGGQVRVDSLTVYADQGGEPPVDPDVPVEPPVSDEIETDADMVVGNVEGSVGETVQVTVSVTNNPGIISAKVRVHFDTTVLKLVGYEGGNFAEGGYSWGDDAMANEEGSFVINWCDATHPDSTADLLATLSFEILEGAPDGSYPITIEFSCDDDMFDTEFETVWFNAVDGSVIVVTEDTVILGDVDGNGKLNNRDLGLLQQYLNGTDLGDKPFDEKAADMDGNGKLNNRDLGKLQVELNG